jgi:hypothetical protein
MTLSVSVGVFMLSVDRLNAVMLSVVMINVVAFVRLCVQCMAAFSQTHTLSLTHTHTHSLSHTHIHDKVKRMASLTTSIITLIKPNYKSTCIP